MRFSSRTLLRVGAVVLCGALFNGCTKKDENLDGEVEPVEATGAEEAAVPPAPPAVEQSTSPATTVETGGVTSAPSTVAPSGSATRRVLYVKTNGTAVREKPENNARVLSKLDRGDHLLVNIEGEWARTDQGGYISMKALSEKGIGRTRAAVRWRGGNGEAASGATSKAAKKAAKKDTAVSPPAATPVATPAPTDAAASDQSPQ